jgi:microcystin-dependent protein
MGGSAASRLTTVYFGANSGQPATTLGNVGGLESHTLTTAQLASHSHSNTLSDPGHAHTATQQQSSTVISSGGGGAGYAGGGSNPIAVTSGFTINSATSGVTIINAGAGGGNAHPNVQPTIVSNYIMRVL